MGTNAAAPISTVLVVTVRTEAEPAVDIPTANAATTTAAKTTLQVSGRPCSDMKALFRLARRWSAGGERS